MQVTLSARFRPAAVLAAAACALALATACAQPPAPQSADLVVVNGIVYPGAGAPQAQAVAVRGKEVVRVGTNEEVRALAGPQTTVVDAKGSAVLPGFNDSHVHFLSGGESLDQVDLFGAGNVREAQQAIVSFAQKQPDRPWVMGRGWLYGSFPGGLPSKAQLDEIVRDRPAFMECYDGHTAWVNSAALKLAGITRDTPDPVNGQIVRDPKTGEPTGVLKESAQGLVRKAIPTLTKEDKLRTIKRAIAEAQRLGVTSVQNAGMSPDEYALYDELEKSGELGVRMYIALSAPPGFTEEQAKTYDELLKAHPGTTRLKTGAVKMYADGVIESHTAAMLAPYANRPSSGTPNYSVEDMNRIVAMMDARGWQVWIHAIGDRGIRMALDAYEAAATANPAPARGRRHRVEHIEDVSAADIPRFGALGVIASMQPDHATPIPNVLNVWAVNVGPERAARAWAWKSIADAGGRLAFGTDWPVVGLDPRHGMHTALTRQTLDGAPPGGFNPQQRLPLAAVIDGWTSGAAYASFEETRKGTLAPGMLADIAVLSTDIFKAAPDQVKSFEVATTILDGQVVYSKAK